MSKKLVSRSLWKVKRDSASRAVRTGAAVVLTGGRRAVARHGGVTISGSLDAVEDYLDAREIDRRLSDPANHERLTWSKLKARRGLESRG